MPEEGYQSDIGAPGSKGRAKVTVGRTRCQSWLHGRTLQQLDRGFFRVRFDRLTPREKGYVRAMAELGPGPHRSGDIAQRLGIGVTSAGPLRSSLVRKGMIFSPQHGDTAFTVPMFDEFMKRAMPEWQPEPVHGAGPGRRRRR
jgi:hypothetical protein